VTCDLYTLDAKDDAECCLRRQYPMWAHPDLQLDDIRLLVAPATLVLMERFNIHAEGSVNATSLVNCWMLSPDPGWLTVSWFH
jgi:hypothetical protein